ncbi:MAG: pseudouridine synthase [Polyangiales bacterium]
MPVERLQKVLARAGVASRRHAEAFIVEGRVRVNGQVVTELGTRVDPRRDKVELDGRRIVLEGPVYAMLHKPRGVVTTLSDPEGRPALGELVKGLGARVFPIGRLDFHTSGALLVTNDGALAQALLHPRHHVPKVYVCKVRGVPSDAQLDAWRQGVMLHPTESDPDERAVKTLPAQVRILRNAPPGDDAGAGAGSTWLEVTLHEGRTRQIHRMAEATGLFVMRLARISFAGITTEGLRPGDMRALSDKEVTALRVQYLRPLETGAIPAAPTEEARDEAPARPKRPAPKMKSEPGHSKRESGPMKPPAPKMKSESGHSKREAGPMKRDERATRRPEGARPPTTKGARTSTRRG